MNNKEVTDSVKVRIVLIIKGEEDISKLYKVDFHWTTFEAHSETGYGAVFIVKWTDKYTMKNKDY